MLVYAGIYFSIILHSARRKKELHYLIQLQQNRYIQAFSFRMHTYLYSTQIGNWICVSSWAGWTVLIQARVMQIRQWNIVCVCMCSGSMYIHVYMRLTQISDNATYMQDANARFWHESNCIPVYMEWSHDVHAVPCYWCPTIILTPWVRMVPIAQTPPRTIRGTGNGRSP